METNMKSKWIKRIIGISSSVMIIVILTGCSCERGGSNNVPSSGSSGGSSNSTVVNGSSTVSGSGNNDGNSTVSTSGGDSAIVKPGTATEVDRSVGNYDFDTWVRTGPDPDIALKVRPEWEETNDQNSEGFTVRWAYPQQSVNKIFYERYFNNLKATSKEIVMDKVNALVAKGLNVEYGNFQFIDSATWPKDGFYYKCLNQRSESSNENIEYDIQVFFTYGVSGGQMTYFSISYNDGSIEDGSNSVITEADFWQAAYSLHLEPDMTVPPPQPSQH